MSKFSFISDYLIYPIKTILTLNYIGIYNTPSPLEPADDRGGGGMGGTSVCGHTGTCRLSGSTF